MSAINYIKCHGAWSLKHSNLGTWVDFLALLWSSCLTKSEKGSYSGKLDYSLNISSAWSICSGFEPTDMNLSFSWLVYGLRVCWAMHIQQNTPWDSLLQLLSHFILREGPTPCSCHLQTEECQFKSRFICKSQHEAPWVPSTQIEGKNTLPKRPQCVDTYILIRRKAWMSINPNPETEKPDKTD